MQFVLYAWNVKEEFKSIAKTRLFKYIEKFTTKKMAIFQIKKSYIFHIIEVVLTSTHNLCFWAEITKIMYTPVNPSFTI